MEEESILWVTWYESWKLAVDVKRLISLIQPIHDNLRYACLFKAKAEAGMKTAILLIKTTFKMKNTVCDSVWSQ